MAKFLLSFLCLVFSAQTKADLAVVQALSFGDIVVTSNSSVQRVIVDDLGNVSMTSGIRPITVAQPGIFQLSNYPPNSQVFVTASVSQATSNSDVVSDEQFVLANLIAPASVIVDPDGTALLQVGGELVTSGSGSRNFADTRYSVQMLISLNF